MNAGIRFGVMLGSVVATAVLCLRYDYRPHILDQAPALVVAVAPAAAWLAIELAGWLRSLVRVLSRLFLLVGVAAAGGWGLWLYGLLGWGQADPTMRYAVPSVLAGGYLTALWLATRVTTNRTNRERQDRPVEQPEVVSH